MKMWMVEGQWKLPKTESWQYETVMPIRSVVRAKTKREAQKGADEAVREAVRNLQDRDDPEGEMQGTATVLYAM
jgi:hypothetical protein